VLAFNSTAALEVRMESSELGGGVLLGIKPSERIVQTKWLSDSDGGVKRRNSLAKSSRRLLDV
jgi:hypothetical protein